MAAHMTTVAFDFYVGSFTIGDKVADIDGRIIAKAIDATRQVVSIQQENI
jgi:hypothetical protein